MAKSSSGKAFSHKSGDGRQKPRPGPEEQMRCIVDAAVSLFLEKGVRSVSVMQICKKADVSRSTFYRCFDDIDSLLEYIYSVSVFDPVKQFMKANITDDKLSLANLREALDEMYESIFQQSAYAELLFRESNDPNSPAYEIVNKAFDDIVLALLARLPQDSNKKVDTIYLKSILNANQWIALDAIRKGLTPQARKQAKQAAWRLVTAAMGLDTAR